MGEEALLHDSTLACLGDAELRGVALVSKEARKHALVFLSVATYKCVGVTGEATLAPLQLVNRDDDARRGACRCAPSRWLVRRRGSTRWYSCLSQRTNAWA